MTRAYITTAIPYVNAAPHLGHALEYVQADVLARHKRLRGCEVRFQSGTDDHALKNVLSARAANQNVEDYVNSAGDRFIELLDTLDISIDDVLRTSIDGRHRAGVEALWHRSELKGDFYRNSYDGLYCTGCEQFYSVEELVDEELCPEHLSAPERIAETNWFFRLSKYQDRIESAILSGEVRVNPPEKRNEVLGMLREGLDDISVSRPAERASGWGIAVPGDPSQVVYVWWDALANYITSLGIDSSSPDFLNWWEGSEERVHVIGKGIVRFHAVYWLGLLLSVGIRLPTTIHVHDYVTIEGAKLSKSLGNVVDPVEIVDQYGVDALRWWLVRDVPLLGDAEYSTERLIQLYNTDLANGVGNLVNRTLTLVNRNFSGRLHSPRGLSARELPSGEDTLGGSVRQIVSLTSDIRSKIDDALGDANFRLATLELMALVDSANSLLSAAAPWSLVKGSEHDRQLAHRVLTLAVEVERVICRELLVFCPGGGVLRLLEQLCEGDSVLTSTPVFSRLE